MHEFEGVFEGIDPQQLEAQLSALGATKVGEYNYRRRVFDYPDWRLDEGGSWIRLRDEGDTITLTYKRRLGMKSNTSEQNDEGMEEIEVEVSDFDKTTEILTKAGLVEKFYMENRRIRWQKDGITFDIDFWPELEPYLEIEADSWEQVDTGARLLGLDPDSKKICTTSQLYMDKGIDVSDYVSMTFDGFTKRS